MSVQNYTELLAHKGHDIKIHTYYDENVAIECNDCFEVLLDFDNDQKVCVCEVCESPDKHNIYAEGFCQECYEECRECDRCGYSPCAGDAIYPTCSPENYLSNREENK